MITSQTRVFAILGDPIAHSRSPLIHNAALRATGIDAVYVALRCSGDALPGAMGALAHADGGGNVTLPHKGAAADIVDRASSRVRATHACNTFWLKAGRVHGDNTDVIGFSTALKSLIEDVRGTRALVIGAGGGARAVLHALLEDGCSGVTVLGRNRRRASEIAEVAGRRHRRVAFITNDRLLSEEGFDLVVNATPLGMRAADSFPLRLGRLGGLTAVFDIVYKPGGTRWVNYARALGIPAVDGSEMLIHQAAAAFELWFDAPAPLDAMRAGFDA
ncbi:MAG TPA: shikimate dehydrogenase [Longimicrobiales bacterium]